MSGQGRTVCSRRGCQRAVRINSCMCIYVSPLDSNEQFSPPAHIARSLTRTPAVDQWTFLFFSFFFWSASHQPPAQALVLCLSSGERFHSLSLPFSSAQSCRHIDRCRESGGGVQTAGSREQTYALSPVTRGTVERRFQRGIHTFG